MRRVKILRRASALVVPVLLATLLAGCGDDGDDGGTPSGDGDGSGATTAADEPTGTGSPGIPLIPGGGCEAEVALSGKLDKEWSGKATVSESKSGPPAVYQSADDASVLTVYAAGNGFDDSVILNDGTDSYGTIPGTKGLEIAKDGSGATVDAELIVPGKKDQTVRVKATITCKD